MNLWIVRVSERRSNGQENIVVALYQPDRPGPLNDLPEALESIIDWRVDYILPPWLAIGFCKESMEDVRTANSVEHLEDLQDLNQSLSVAGSVLAADVRHSSCTMR